MAWKFRRQVVLGNYIVDFYCSQLQIAIEVDGTQHYLEEGLAYDAARDEWLSAHGCMVLRYSNEAIHHCFDSVCEDIVKQCRRRESEMEKPPCR